MLGINTVHTSINQANRMGFKHVEVCLGRTHGYRQANRHALAQLKRASTLGLDISVHLPLFIFEWYPFDYLSAFFLDRNVKRRELSFRLLEENLKRLNDYPVKYYVLHFPGVNHHRQIDNFQQLLCGSLYRINKLAEKYQVKIYLEYFGSNHLFYEYKNWIDQLNSYSNVELLLDTGHLYFASEIHQFSYTEAFYNLSQVAEAFHFWTVRAGGFYKNNSSYKKYHHIVPNLDQRCEEGWAFTTEEIFRQMKARQKPIIIEASDLYRGREYYTKSIKELLMYNN